MEHTQKAGLRVEGAAGGVYQRPGPAGTNAPRLPIAQGKRHAFAGISCKRQSEIKIAQVHGPMGTLRQKGPLRDSGSCDNPWGSVACRRHLIPTSAWSFGVSVSPSTI